MVKYFIEIKPVDIADKSGGYVETFNERTLVLDPSYSDKVDFSVNDVILYHKKRDRYLLDKKVFVKILNNAKKYNKFLGEKDC